MLCIHLADVKAATISRKLRKPRKEGNYHKTFRIWRDARKTKEELEKDKKEVSADPDVIKR